jgi:hypothetical protein
MDMAFDLENTASGRMRERSVGCVAHPSWPDLLSRMIAARQASASMVTKLREDIAIEHGSFDEGAAACVAAQAHSRTFVNPNDLGNRKPGGAISSPVAGPGSTGGRG